MPRARGRETTPDRTGLTGAEARERLRRIGPNTLPPPPRESAARRLVRQFRSPLIYILLVALAVDALIWIESGARGVPLEAIAIAAILFFNAGLGVWQEHKAEHILNALTALALPRAWVWREGRLQRIDGTELVPGDLIRLDAGDRVPADAVAREAARLMVDEAVLTGESLPVDKLPGDELHAGTLLVRGHATATVARTGSASAMGRLSTMLGAVERQPTPLERQLDRFGRQVAIVVVLLAVLLVIGGVLAEGSGRFWPVVLFAVALAVASVPEGLPAVMTLTLMLGVQRMARRRALVRKLAAVEALGSVTVIATDKTGTLTAGRLEVHAFDSPDIARALAAAILASEADAAAGAADPLDEALLRHAAAGGHEPARLHAARPRHSERPFDAAWSFMRATVHENGRRVSYLKGAPEVLLARCVVSEEARRSWLQRIEERAAEGYRVLGLAWGEDEREADLEWLGLVLLWDPPRPEVPDAVRLARAAGIRVLMLTGDHPGTARTVARAVGIEERDVYARLTPERKLRIVEELQASGEVVAVTGDGVNDAPALKRADVGIAMGERGSDLAREVADLVLLDDNFATIVAAIEEGRSIYENIQKFVRFLLSTNFSELLIVAVGAALAVALDLRDADGWLLVPLTAIQLLWINLISDGAPALALGLDRNPGVMRRTPRPPARLLLDRRSLGFIGLSGCVKAGIALALLGLLPWALGMPPAVAASANFLFMTTGQLLFAWPARRTDLRPAPNRILLLAVLFSVAVQLAVMLVPALRAALGVVPLPAAAWLSAAAGLGLTWLSIGLVQRLLWRTELAGALPATPSHAGWRQTGGPT